MEVFEIGTQVLLDGDIPATITAISIRGVQHFVTYEVTWWDGRNRKIEWMDPFEIRAKEEKRHIVEFVSQGFRRAG